MQCRYFVNPTIAKLLNQTGRFRRSSLAVPCLRPEPGGYRLSIAVQAAGPFDPERTIVVSGASRSGTSWLGEMLSCLPDYALAFEPTSRDLN